MLHWLRTERPATLFFLLLYGVIVKLFYFVHPLGVIRNESGDGPFYIWLVEGFEKNLSFGSFHFTFLAFFLLFLEAVLLNSLVLKNHILSERTYFTAFSFILFSSLLPNWNTFSAPLLATLPFLYVLYQSFSLPDTPNRKMTSFNLGLAIGSMLFIYVPSVVLLLVVWAAMIILSSFRLSEWLLSILGFLCPLYLWATYLFLTDQLSTFLGAFSLETPDLFPLSFSLSAAWSVCALLLFILYGSILQQKKTRGFLTRIKRSWNVLWISLFILLAYPFLYGTFHFSEWLFFLLLSAIFMAKGFQNTYKRGLLLFLHFLAIGSVLYLQWFH